MVELLSPRYKQVLLNIMFLFVSIESKSTYTPTPPIFKVVVGARVFVMRWRMLVNIERWGRGGAESNGLNNYTIDGGGRCVFLFFFRTAMLHTLNP